MKASQLYLTHLALASCTTAIQYGPTTGSGYGPSAPGTPDFLTLNHNPKLSKSQLLTSGWGIATEIPGGKSPSQTLTWRINITEAAIPNASNASSGPIPNPRMLNTVYDLSWQGDGNLQETMSEIQKDAKPSRSEDLEAPQLCATVFTAFFPANVTNAYTASSQDSCSGALGDCLGPLLSTTGTTGASGCPIVRDPSTIPACAGVFENNGAPATLELTQNGTGIANSSFPLLSGNGFFFQSSGVYEEGNRTVWDQERLRLHVMVLDTVRSARRAVCSRVDAELEAEGRSTGAADGIGAAVGGSRVSFWGVGGAFLGALALLS
ncbi:uncharacterized protein RCC_06162 [Ramularia collo-cygni]|uniref:Uncharacterized protein n=1 Tax=Ramularia collo-cygni TaxID=112498 RepID=A0A2D3VHQ9_9PEZI|nr:uncharacterized protein RCC_06162 [Ramularia collo-cygni]CZT20303.1 uncharacterized protein RCC_06162 [Ramularia collo-cygni]